MHRRLAHRAASQLLMRQRPNWIQYTQFRCHQQKTLSRKRSNPSSPSSSKHTSKELSTSSSSDAAAAATSQWNSPSTSGRDDASLARYPNLQTAGGMLRAADYAGTITFALTGTITAAQSGLDVFGSAMVGVITSVGGGTIRDSIFLNRKPFWTEETEYIWMGLLTGLVTFFVWPTSVLAWQEEKQEREQRRRRSNTNGTNHHHHQQQSSTTETTAIDKPENGSYDTVNAILDTLDAVGLSAFAIIGAQNGIRAGIPMVVSAICGMATATFGGVCRDVLCGRPVRIVHSTTEVYAPPALAGATVYLASQRMGGSPFARIGAAILTCMGSRYFAVKNDVKLHTWDTAHDNLGVTIRKKPTKHITTRST